jgi:hypothetical protein
MYHQQKLILKIFFLKPEGLKACFKNIDGMLPDISANLTTYPVHNFSSKLINPSCRAVKKAGVWELLANKAVKIRQSLEPGQNALKK